LYSHFFNDDPDLMLNIVQGGQVQIDPTDREKAKDLKLEVDHIFPRSRLRDAGMGDVADCIGNFRLVVLPVNRRKTNHWPDKDTDFYGSQEPEVSAAYRQALTTWNRDNYLKFESARAAFIQRQVEQFLGLKTGEQEVLPLPPPEPFTSSTPQPHTPQADASIEEVCQAAAPEPEAQTDEGPGIYFVNTNSRADPDAWRDMLSGSKAAAYYDRKASVAKIPVGSVVYLYHTRTGVIAKGITTEICKKADFDGDPDEEFYVPLAMEWKLDDPTMWGRAVTASEIKDKMNAYHPFRGTSFTISAEMAAAIDEIWKGKQISPSSTP
jgi:hypothetical protein